MKIVKLLITASLTFLFVANICAQTKPPSAWEVVKGAQSEALKAHKNVFIIFHASWCVWCRKMDTAMNDKSIKSFFDKNYVIRHLSVDESPGKKNLENPGATELREKYKGDHQGIPYWFIINADGKLLADSRLHSEDGQLTGNNVGCPATPVEVGYFVRVIKKTSELNDTQLASIRERFSKNN
ncbi:MAG: thioredoxin family protein [Ginsengibacter sp.]